MNDQTCDGCGISVCDLPDGVDPDLIFDRSSGRTLCQGCEGDDRDDESTACPNGDEDCPTEYLCAECYQDRKEQAAIDAEDARQGR